MVVREAGEWQGVDPELDLVDGEAEGQPGSVSHGKGAVEVGGQGVQVWCKGCCGVVVSDTRGMMDLVSLTLAVTTRARVQLASLRTRAAMLGNVTAIRRDSVCLVGKERVA